jgi:opacity protein-like surface antigen
VIGFGPQSMNFTTPTESASTSASLNVQEVKAGVNYRFGGEHSDARIASCD